MALDPAFVEDCPYGPGAILLDEILDVDREASVIRARMAASEELPFTRDQRTHPVRHPRHVAGSVMVHASGILGFAHAYYCLDLRHADGWIGYGTTIHGARFRKLATCDAPIEMVCRSTDLRKIRGSLFGRYEFRFWQGGELVYEGDQSAIFTRVGAEEKAG